MFFTACTVSTHSSLLFGTDIVEMLFMEVAVVKLEQLAHAIERQTCQTVRKGMEGDDDEGSLRPKGKRERRKKEKERERERKREKER